MVEKIKADQLQARKEHDKIKAGNLTALIGEISIVGKNARNGETTDEESLTVIKKFIKNTNETLRIFIDASMKLGADPHSIEKINELRAEIKMYESYLPKQLNTDELKEIIQSFLKESSDNDSMKLNVGTIMNFLKEFYNGQYDGKTASSIAKALINND